MRSQNNIMNIISVIYFMVLAIATSTLLLGIVFPNEIGITVSYNSVSYTHLTLPTIYSV